MEPNDEHQGKRPFNAKTLVFGLLVILLGLTWLLRNTGVISESTWDIIFSWEMLLIALGVIFLFNESGKFWGFLLIAVGGFFLLSDFYDFPTTFRKVFWPALLIIGGIYLIWGARRITRKREIPEGAEPSDFIDEVSIFSGGEKRFSSDSLKGGQMVSIFGGSTIDLTQCKLAEYAEIETTSIFGGFTLVIPAEWNIRLEVTHIFGGVSDKRPKAEVDKSKTLVIKGAAIFGGGEIKSY
jgi:predicted membrane protein